MTQCNHCTLQGMRRRAQERGVTVVLGRDESGWVTARYDDQDEPCASFMALTDVCAC